MKAELLKPLFLLPLHPTFWVTAVSWLSACLLKVLILGFQTGAMPWGRFFSSGGMPSTHMAFASGMTISIGMSQGFDSAVFGLSLGLSILTAADAIGLRRAAGHQAELLNRLAETIFKSSASSPQRLNETLGHSVPEMLAGIAVGAGVAFFLYPIQR